MYGPNKAPAEKLLYLLLLQVKCRVTVVTKSVPIPSSPNTYATFQIPWKPLPISSWMGHGSDSSDERFYWGEHNKDLSSSRTGKSDQCFPSSSSPNLKVCLSDICFMSSHIHLSSANFHSWNQKEREILREGRPRFQSDFRVSFTYVTIFYQNFLTVP